MPGWRDDYLASIQDAQMNDPVNRELLEACSQLQDRVAALEAEKDALVEAASSSPIAPAKGAPAAKAAAVPSDGSGTPTSDPAATARLRLDLAESLRAQGQLQTRLKVADEELERLRRKTTEDTRTLRLLTAERNTLATKVRDRDEELRGKSKLVENVQDELLALTLQLNVLEKQKSNIQAENKQLVERWMQRMGQEADALNLASEPLFTKRHK